MTYFSGALNQLTRNLACEWAKHGIRVNTVAPWYINTDLAQQVPFSKSSSELRDFSAFNFLKLCVDSIFFCLLQVLKDEKFKSDVVSRTPMRRVGEPEEVAAAVAFFCLGASSFVSGQILAIDGAFSVNGFYPTED